MRSLSLAALWVSLGISMPVSHAETPPSADFYVSPQGNDTWSGTLAEPNATGTDGPFATLSRARDAIRAADKAKTRPWDVRIRGGVYRLTEPIVFTPEDSGSDKGSILYAAWPGERPIFSGGRVIKDWQPTDGPIWTAKIPQVATGDWYFHQLFMNGQRRTRARTPNEGYYHIDGYLPGITSPQKDRENVATKLGFRYKAGQFKQWKNLDDVNVVLYHSWTSSIHHIKELNEAERLVHFTAPCGWPIGYWDGNPRFFVENYPAALDAPGEWYLDRTSGVLSYWPAPDEDMSKVQAVAPVTRSLLRLEGDFANGRYIDHVYFKGLTFEHSAWKIPDRGTADGQAAVSQQSAVFGQGIRHCRFENCTLRYLGEYALHLGQGCQHNEILRCHLHDLGAGGLRIGHTRSPAGDADACRYNTIDNCFVHDGGHVFDAGVGIWIGMSDHNTVSHNVVRDFDYTGISVGWSWGYVSSACNHNLIEYNHVSNIGRGVLSDMGGIYTLGLQPGTVVRNNIFHHIYSYDYGGWGLYTDEGSSHIVMENNLVHKTKTGGFHQHYGKENILRNNIFAFAREAQLQYSRPQEPLSFTFERNIVYFDNGHLLKGNWDGDEFKMDHNIYWDTSEPKISFAGYSFAQWQQRGLDTNSRIVDPQFIDPEHFDFRLKKGSPVLEVGFKPLDLDKVGLYGDAEWTALPKRMPADALYFPAPTEGRPVRDDFEGAGLGAAPANARISTGQHGLICISDEQARSGQHSIKIVDSAQLEQNWQPMMTYDPALRCGTIEARFSVYRQSQAMFYHQWRDDYHAYKVGPSIFCQSDGQLQVDSKTLMQLPEDKWIDFIIVAGLGPQANGHFDLTVTIEGQQPQIFENLAYASKRFYKLDWFGFVADSKNECTFYLDDISIEVIHE